MTWPEAPVLPSIQVPEPFVLPEPTIEVPEVELPKYPPLVVPPSDLRPPPSIKGDPVNESEAPEQKTPPPQIPKDLPPEAQLVEVPFTDMEVLLPSATIMSTAFTTSVISVAATLTATSLFKYLVMVMKPILKQLWTRITKRGSSSAS